MSKVKMNLDGLHRLRRNAEALHGTHKIPVADLLSADFMRSVSSFASFEEMLAQSPFTVDSAEDFKAIPDAEWDDYVRKTTRFSSWREMLQAAAAAWTKARLFR